MVFSSSGKSITLPVRRTRCEAAPAPTCNQQPNADQNSQHHFSPPVKQRFAAGFALSLICTHRSFRRKNRKMTMPCGAETRVRPTRQSGSAGLKKECKKRISQAGPDAVHRPRNSGEAAAPVSNATDFCRVEAIHRIRLLELKTLKGGAICFANRPGSGPFSGMTNNRTVRCSEEVLFLRVFMD